MPEWIYIADRLPDTGNDVWIYDKDYGVCIGSYYMGYWTISDDRHDPTDLWDVTHWMPLIKPEPPNEHPPRD